MKDTARWLINRLRSVRVLVGVGDGVRTRDIRCHRPTLYQLSYAHHKEKFNIPVKARAEIGPSNMRMTVEEQSKNRTHGGSDQQKKQYGQGQPGWSTSDICSTGKMPG